MDNSTSEHSEATGDDVCSASASTSPLNEDQEELSKILKKLRDSLDLMGCFSLGKDGVLRSLTADRDVIDAIALPPRLIKAMLDREPFDQKLEDDLRGVDGTTVPRAQWFHPDESLLPPPLAEEHREEAKKLIEGNKERLLSAREGPSCPVSILSNYNLEPKGKDEGDG